MEDAGAAGMRQLGIGALLGINNWRYEALCIALHAHVLMSNYWKSRVSVSFPRIRPAEGVNPNWLKLSQIKNLTQAILAFRLCFADIGLVLSTRDHQHLEIIFYHSVLPESVLAVKQILEAIKRVMIKMKTAQNNLQFQMTGILKP